MSFDLFVATVEDGMADVPDTAPEPPPEPAPPPAAATKPSPAPVAEKPATFAQAMRWVAYMVDRHIEIMEWFEHTHAVTDTLYELSREPTIIKGQPLAFPADIRTPKGYRLLIDAVERYRHWRLWIPYLLTTERKRLAGLKRWRRRDTQANWEAYVDCVLSRMAIEGRITGIIYADDSINTTMRLVHGRTLKGKTMSQFKDAWAEVAGSVVRGKKDHHERGTVYNLSPDGSTHGVNIYPDPSNDDVDAWLKPYEDAYSGLTDDENTRSQANRAVAIEVSQVYEVAEAILRSPDPLPESPPARLVVNGKVLTPSGWEH